MAISVIMMGHAGVLPGVLPGVLLGARVSLPGWAGRLIMIKGI